VEENMMRGKVYELDQKDKMFGKIPENKGKKRKKDRYVRYTRHVCTIIKQQREEKKT